MKNLPIRILSLAIALLVAMNAADAQQRKASDAQKKKEKVERSYKKAYAKARKRTIKHRRDIQTDATRQRMDETDKKAKTYNRQNDPGLFERYFGKKRRVKK